MVPLWPETSFPSVGSPKIMEDGERERLLAVRIPMPPTSSPTTKRTEMSSGEMEFEEMRELTARIWVATLPLASTEPRPKIVVLEPFSVRL